MHLKLHKYISTHCGFYKVLICTQLKNSKKGYVLGSCSWHIAKHIETKGCPWKLFLAYRLAYRDKLIENKVIFYIMFII